MDFAWSAEQLALRDKAKVVARDAVARYAAAVAIRSTD
jgi:hypothetical protein